MKRIICIITLLLTVSLAVRNAQATPVTLTAFLSGPNESPPNASPGTGFAVVIVDPAANTLSVNVTFSGLTSGTTASHIHCCVTTPGTGTAIVATTTPTFQNFPLGVTSGTYSNTLDLTLTSSYNPNFITANGGTAASAEAVLIAGLLGDRTYLNIHTTMFPGGEIRGFLVPEPDSLYLLGLGFLVLSMGLARAANKKSATQV